MKLSKNLYSFLFALFLFSPNISAELVQNKDNSDGIIHLETLITSVSWELKDFYSDGSEVMFFIDYSVNNTSEEIVSVGSDTCGPFRLNMTSSLNISLGKIYVCGQLYVNTKFQSGLTENKFSEGIFFPKESFSEEISTVNYIPVGIYRFEIIIPEMYYFKSYPAILTIYAGMEFKIQYQWNITGGNDFISDLSQNPLIVIIWTSTLFTFGAIIANVLKKKNI